MGKKSKQAAIDWTRPIETVDGEPCRLLHISAVENVTYPVVLLLSPDTTNEHPESATRDGRLYEGHVNAAIRNVLPAVPRLTGFIGVYGDSDDPIIGVRNGQNDVPEDVAADLDEKDMDGYDLKAIIDLSKINAEAIEWVES